MTTTLTQLQKKIIPLTLITSISLLFSGCLFHPRSRIPTSHYPHQQSVKPSPELASILREPLASHLSIPVKGVHRQQLTDTWNAARSHGRRHEGIDILAPRNTPVYSTTDGIVRGLAGNPLGGNVVWILGPSQTWHYYAHLQSQRADLKEGDIIHRGELIGYVGNSGNARATVTHLHYGIYLDGKGRGATNPYPYLK